MSDFFLYLVTDEKICGDRSLEFVVEQAVQGGVNLVQLREKNKPVDEIIKTAKKLKTILDRYDVPLIINDHIEVVLATNAAGLHIGQDDFAYENARKILGKNKIIGLSVSNLHELQQAENLDADYLGVGPVFYTDTKPEAAPAIGIEQLKVFRQHSRHRLIAIGGIQQNNFIEIMQTGVDGIAVVSAICAAESPKDAAKTLSNLQRQC